jgi:hypothetical protein
MKKRDLLKVSFSFFTNPGSVFFASWQTDNDNHIFSQTLAQQQQAFTQQQQLFQIHMLKAMIAMFKTVIRFPNHYWYVFTPMTFSAVSTPIASIHNHHHAPTSSISSDYPLANANMPNTSHEPQKSQLQFVLCLLFPRNTIHCQFFTSPTESASNFHNSIIR